MRQPLPIVGEVASPTVSAQGMDISAATNPDTKTGDLAESNMLADRDEDFNTRYGSFRGWQLAIERVKSIPRDIAQVNLSGMGFCT